MFAHYPEVFERDMGCTEAEWLLWLPRAIGDHPWHRDGARAEARIGAGRLVLNWVAEPPRVLGLARIPRLRVGFCFSGLDDVQRRVFMTRFDLYTQRGGG